MFPAVPALLALALVATACSERDREPIAPVRTLAPLLDENGNSRLVVEAQGAVGRLTLDIEGGALLTPVRVELFRNLKDPMAGDRPLVGSVALPPGRYAAYVQGFDRAGTLTHRGKAALLVEKDVTPQRVVTLSPRPGADWATVRIGTFRLALSQYRFAIKAGMEFRTISQLLDANGTPQEIAAGSLTWEPPKFGDPPRLLDIVYSGRDAIEYWLTQGPYSGIIEICQLGAACAPIVITDPTSIVAVAAGGLHACALRSTGSVRCWGDNTMGQAGRTASGQQTLNGYGFKAIAAGLGGGTLGGHTCAIGTGDAVHCWGGNRSGELGTGSTSQGAQPIPQAVALPAPAIAITTGRSHTCALVAGGQAFCWGDNLYGQLGDSSVRRPTPVLWNATPVAVATSERFSAIAAGDAHTCALSVNGSGLHCWGNSQYRQAGNGVVPATNAFQCDFRNFNGTSTWTPCVVAPTPVATLAGINVSAFEAGEGETCVRDGAGSAWCFGVGYHGGTGSAPSANPSAVASNVGWTALGIGAGSRCGLDGAGEAWCWGIGGSGQLGLGNAMPGTNSYVPLKHPGNVAYGAIDVGGSHSCTIRRLDNQVACWGSNLSGQVGSVTPAGFADTPRVVAIVW